MDSTRPTGIRQPRPIQLPTAPSGLSELSASDNNARLSSAMPPPAGNGQKHRLANAYEPEGKQRKTLTERAAEPYRPNSATATHKQTTKSIYGRNTDQQQQRNVFSASTSRMPYNSVIRVPTTHNSGSTIGKPGPSKIRSQSAMSQHLRSQSYNNVGTRPQTSMSDRSVANPLAQSVQSTAGTTSGISPFRNISNPMPPPARPINRQLFKSRGVSSESNSTNALSSSAGSCSTLTITTQTNASRSVSVSSDRRIASLNDTFQKMRLEKPDTFEEPVCPAGEENRFQPNTPRALPSHIPLPTPKKDISEVMPLSLLQASILTPRSLPPPKSRPYSPTKEQFLRPDSNIPAIAWGDVTAVDKRLQSMEELFAGLKSSMEGTTFEKKSMTDIVEYLKGKVTELEAQRNSLTRSNEEFRAQIEDFKTQLFKAKSDAEDQRRNHEIETDELQRKHRNALEDLRTTQKNELEEFRRDAKNNDVDLRKENKDHVDELLKNHKTAIEELERRLTADLEQEKYHRRIEVEELQNQLDIKLRNVAQDIGKKEREANSVRDELRQIESDLEREKALRVVIDSKLAEACAHTIKLESEKAALKARVDFLEGDNHAQGLAFGNLHKAMQDAISAAAEANVKLRQEETLRRKLHNQVQELKGNIRVFARVRPTLDSGEEDAAKISFPDDEADSKEIVIKGPPQKSATGNAKPISHPFSFDRVFGPSSANSDVFEEISQLVQSALDGYNVCIFCYGQTGSGKTYTMSEADGMIPRAVRQIYETAKALEEKGWTYKMEGSFVEVYNEELNDLLGKASDIDKKKLGIRHDEINCTTTITDAEIVELDSPERVKDILRLADKNRSVAATKANARSSRSHSVFILTMAGENSITGEKSQGTLNLVDLAGSERLSHSKAEGQQLKETQSINKSLSCLGDVIGALGRGEGGHVPYRNSKLTYLLQYSLGGNSKTLMFVMISPLQAHLNETLTSLKFATKVHNTHIGTAKRQTKVTTS